ncbi:MAG: hypothetical protein ABMA64_20655 [Myxococcota bacterium]
MIGRQFMILFVAGSLAGCDLEVLFGEGGGPQVCVGEDTGGEAPCVGTPDQDEDVPNEDGSEGDTDPPSEAETTQPGEGDPDTGGGCTFDGDPDSDCDGVPDQVDVDDDGDGVVDDEEGCGGDDLDQDGVPDETDTDDDGDGLVDTADADPCDPYVF